MKFTVVFHYSKEYPEFMWWAFIKETLESTLIQAWNDLCEYTNPRLETWNREFDKLYPDKDGLSDEYMAFMRFKYSPVINELNRNSIYKGTSLCKVTYRLGDELELIQVVEVDNKPLTEMYFTLVEAPN